MLPGPGDHRYGMLPLPGPGDQLLPSPGDQLLPSPGDRLLPSPGDQRLPSLGNQRLPSPALVVLNKLVTTFGKKSNLKFGLIQTPQLH